MPHIPQRARPVPGATGRKQEEEPVEQFPRNYPQTEDEWLARSMGGYSGQVLTCEFKGERFNFDKSPETRREEVLQKIGIPIILCGICLDQAVQSKKIREEMQAILKRNARR